MWFGVKIKFRGLFLLILDLGASRGGPPSATLFINSEGCSLDEGAPPQRGE